MFVFALLIPVMAGAQNFVNSKYDNEGRLTATYTGTDRNNYSFTRFHENGVKKETGVFREGVKHGVWKSWNENGELQASARYRHGMKTGKWTIYNGDDKQVFHISFEKDLIKTATRKDSHGNILANR